MKRMIYRIALLRILCSMIGGHQRYTFNNRTCESPKDYLDCARAFTEEYMRNLRPKNVERRKD